MSAFVSAFYAFLLVAQNIIPANLQEEKRCGIPGTPAHGRATVLKSGYPAGYKIQFACEQGFLMIGNSEQECLENGTWSGQVPFCVTPSIATKFSQSAIASCSSEFSRSVDGDDETCVLLYVNGSSTWWAMNLSQLSDLTILEVLVKGDVPIGKTALLQSLQFHLSDVRFDHSDYHHLRCEQRRSKFKWQRFSLRLRPSRQSKGRYLYLRSFEPSNLSYLRICEIKFITKEHSKFLCGDPEVPLNGIVERTERQTATTTCQSNFELVGPSVRTCDDNGVWSTPTSRCISNLIAHDDENIPGPYLYIAIGMGSFFILVVIGFAFYFCHSQRRMNTEMKNFPYSGATTTSSISETLFNETYCGSVLDDFPFTTANQYGEGPQNDIITSSRRNSRLPSCSSSSDRRASCRSDTPSKRISFCRVSSGSREKPYPLDIQRVHSNSSIQFPEGAHIYSEIIEDQTLPKSEPRLTPKVPTTDSLSPVVLNPVYLEPDDLNNQKMLPIYTEPYGSTQI